MKKTLTAALTALSLATAGTPAMAASGDHKEWIDILSIHWSSFALLLPAVQR